VIILSLMNNMCIKMVMKGKSLKLESNEAVALASYVTSLNAARKIQAGGE
jgi:hypothetical protein